MAHYTIRYISLCISLRKHGERALTFACSEAVHLSLIRDIAGLAPNDLALSSFVVRLAAY